MSMHTLTQNLDRGTHHDAQAAQLKAMAAFVGAKIEPKSVKPSTLHKAAQAERGGEDEPITSGRYFSTLCESEGVAPTDAQLKAAESYWLEFLDVRLKERVRAEKVKAYARERWAIDAVMAECGINVRNAQAMLDSGVPTVSKTGSATVQKAFTSSTVQVIFPFYYSAAIQAGILASPILDKLIMEDIPVNSHTADHAAMTDNLGDHSTRESSEGARSTQVIIRATNKPVTLRHFKSKALASYESLRLERIPIFERGLMRVGQQFMISITDFGMETLVAGDANESAAETLAVSAGKNYSDVVALELLFTMGYEMEAGQLIAPKQVLGQLLNMAEFKDPLAGGRYPMHGELPTPIGHNLNRWDVTGQAGTWNTGMLMHVKPGISMIKYTEGGLLVETDRLIDAQWDMSIASTWTGFGIFDHNGTKISTGW